MFLLCLTALALLGPVESDADRLLRPTLVKLDYADQPIAQVVQSLAERTGVPMSLYPDLPTASCARRISLIASQPVAFWAAIDRLEPSAGLILDVRNSPRELTLFSDLGTLGLVSYDRVFRCRLASLNDEREFIYGDPRGRFHSSFRPLAGAADGKEQGSRWGRFFAEIEVMTEPRVQTYMLPAGPPRLLEAVDDRGHSLILEPEAKPFDYPRKFYDEGWYAGFSAKLYLKTPHPAARAIRRLKGAVPVVLFGRRGQPLEVPLKDATGRTFTGAGVSLKIVKLTTGGPVASLLLELRPDSPLPPEDRRNLLFDTHPELLVYRYNEQFEVLDAAGRQLEYSGQSSGYDPPVTRAMLRIKTGRPRDVPGRVRFHGRVRVETDVSLEFADIALP